MSEIDFIPSKTEYGLLIKRCNEVNNAHTPEEIASASRSVLESILMLVYKVNNKAYPENVTLFELINDRVISSFYLHKELIESLHYVRKLGMNALHNMHIKKTQAKLARENILYIVRYTITKIENPKDVDKLILPRYMSEATTRKIYIDMYLKEAGWEVVEPSNTTKLSNGVEVTSGVVCPSKACCEIPVDGMNNKSGIGFCDYVLYGANGMPLAIIEAKKTSEEITKGLEQVKEYGRCMQAKYGYTPILYYTNGYEIRVIDGLYVDRQVMGFHSIDELDLLIKRRKRKIIEKSHIDTSIAGRPYQIQAVTTICERFNSKFRRSLLVMATGTGKTRTAISMVKLLTENDWIKNVLFLADRTSLVEQAFKNFNNILPQLSYQVLSDKSLADEPNARVVFSTHQTMINYIDSENKEYTCGRFDLIIIDEAHRSIFNKYGSIFNYFDALLVGLTATPRSEVDADTYKLFDCESGEPHFEYKLDDAIKDKYLVPYRVESRTTRLLKEGIKYNDLSENDKRKVESVLPINGEENVDFIIPKETLFKIIYNKSTCKCVLEELMGKGIRVNGGQLIGKTIIFAYNHKHAELIVNTFREMYPSYGDDYCQLIDNKVKGADGLITKFEEQSEFRIAVSVDMLDTGIDVPAVLNLVFFKPVKSHIKFLQMIGRGTRLCEGVVDGKDKTHFLIFDYFNNFQFFDENPNGIENVNGKSLSQKLFDLKLDILVELQSYERQSDEKCKAYYDKLKSLLYEKVQNIKKNSSRISVREEMPYVDKYVDYEEWTSIAPLSKKEIQLHLSKLIDNDLDEDISALRFDAQMLQIELSLLANGSVVRAASQIERVRKVAKLLLDTAFTQPSVKKQEASLKVVVSKEFWDKPEIDKLEQYRDDIRDLLIYIKNEIPKINIDTPDEIKEEEYNGGLIDIRTYKEKVIDYLLLHSDNDTIRKIKNLEKIDAEDMKELESILWNELGTAEEYHNSTDIDNLAVFIRSIVGIEQEVINEKFGEFLMENTLNSTQQEFVRAIIDYVRENGDIEVEDLIEKAPFDEYNITDLFGAKVHIITRIVNLVHDSVMVA